MTKRILCAMASMAAAAGAAFGQATSDGYDSTWLPKVEPTLDWWSILYLIVAVAGVAVVAFKNARRTHLD